tara:strand:+ start:73 stop:240 length:168 start_codon:yes stop_codon:yes gene_type:complete
VPYQLKEDVKKSHWRPHMGLSAGVDGSAQAASQCAILVLLEIHREKERSSALLSY